MNVLLCQINSKYIHSALAAWCLKAGISNFSTFPHSAEVVEATINEKQCDVLNRLTQKSPDIVGFCCYIWNIDYVKAVAKMLKATLPDCKIVLGGPEVSYNVKDTLNSCDFVDYVISGEGEYPIAYLCDCIQSGTAPQNNGISYRSGNALCLSEPYITASEPPTPYCDEYFNTLSNRIAYIETSRGCPYSCAFCLSGRCGKVRFFDMERTKSEIIRLSQSGCKTLKFVDRTFNANKKRAEAIVEFILDNIGTSIPRDVCFHFEIAADILSDRLAELFASAPKGSIQLEIGMQSFNEQTLAAVTRKTDCEKLKANIARLIRPKNIHIHIDLIAGLPFEDLNSFKNSFNTAYNLYADMLQLGFLKLLHGAEMRINTEKYPCVYSKDPPYEVISTPYISAQELNLLHRVEDVVERTYNSGRFRRTLSVLCQTGTPPFNIFEYIATRLPDDLSGTPLERYCDLLYSLLSSFPNIDAETLRDAMVCDITASVCGGKLPSSLKRDDPFLKTARHFLQKRYPAPKGVMRATALLYGENVVLYCDYTACDPVNKQYTLHKIPFSQIVK